ncbi:hypothetical protein E0W68_02765 [Flavobacterium salilacus subsp. salilacus]|uniref:hypothetical protein n=1 Tax=Flavobacterium TaxID=237 RepID=UPI001074FAF0|nr:MULTISPECIES: hypothetical protein [Flavobacterium]KAF2520163.1 hypothetical protein E0W68_02765 [Flavobacterium salilacus subsp. salilacus]MBE1613921.1 hypothetical protein [Flavobacterium sp. SaA2.13]NDI97970.1 hypothetical protein [Flavobacterium salilacus subsp. altitudinum]
MSALLDRILFRIGILKRFLLILFKRKKEIKLVHFNYACDRDSNDTVIIRYNFENVLWYEFNDQKTFEKRQVICRPDNGEKELQLTVRGLYNKNNYTVVLQPNKVSILGMVNCKNRNRIIYDHAKIKS